MAQLRTGVSNSMGWYQRLVDGGFHPGHNRRCRWCGLSEETVTHVYNECEDLQLIGLRHDISTATGRVLNAACLVTDPASALEYHDRAIGLIQRRGVQRSQEVRNNVMSLAQWLASSVTTENLLPIFGTLRYDDLYGRIRAIRTRFRTSNRHGVILCVTKLLELKVVKDLNLVVINLWIKFDLGCYG